MVPCRVRGSFVQGQGPTAALYGRVCVVVSESEQTPRKLSPKAALDSECEVYVPPHACEVTQNAGPLEPRKESHAGVQEECVVQDIEDLTADVHHRPGRTLWCAARGHWASCLPEAGSELPDPLAPGVSHKRVITVMAWASFRPSSYVQ